MAWASNSIPEDPGPCGRKEEQPIGGPDILSQVSAGPQVPGPLRCERAPRVESTTRLLVWPVRPFTAGPRQAKTKKTGPRHSLGPAEIKYGDEDVTPNSTRISGRLVQMTLQKGSLLPLVPG